MQGAYDATRAVAFQKALAAPIQGPIYSIPAPARFPYHTRPGMPSHIHSTHHLPAAALYHTQPATGQQREMHPHNHSTLPGAAPPPPIAIHTPIHPRAQPPVAPRMKSIPLPPQVSGVTSVALHPALAHSGTALVVDLALGAPSNAALQWQWEQLSSTAATHPPLPSLSIISPRLPWGITAHASGSILRSGVSVADVLSAIWEALGREVDREGFRGWEMMQMGRDSRGSGRRMMDRTRTTLTYRDGMTRIELLEGRTTFKGLSASDMGCDTWILESA
ncbi:hypothetical protein C8R46DRAFT_482307 [Mycena filopes]|nr:hypothetical protein C8R46DRAFT_482307 [Mycena filopes]